MESSLSRMIRYIEQGTRLHIGALFFEHYGNSACELPQPRQIHCSAVCDHFKAISRASFLRCLRCRNMAIQKALREQKPFGGLCINGVYEYTYPIVIGQTVACILFIGNVLESSCGDAKLRKRLGNNVPLLDTLETAVSAQECRNMAELLEEYIRFLLEQHPQTSEGEEPLIKNIKAYVTCNLALNIRLPEIAAVFHYNPRYLGRLFKQHTGMSFSEFVNHERIRQARHSLVNTSRSVIEIAGEVGFENVTYFNRVFKAATGYTPTHYRQLHT